MLYVFINRAKTAPGRRILAVLMLVLFVPLCVGSMMFGISYAIVSVMRTLAIDLYYTLTNEIPTVVGDFVRVIKTGKRV